MTFRAGQSTQLQYNFNESTDTTGQTLQVKVVKTDFLFIFFKSKSTEVLGFKST